MVKFVKNIHGQNWVKSYLGEMYQINSALQPVVNTKQGGSVSHCLCESISVDHNIKLQSKPMYKMSIKFIQPGVLPYFQNSFL